MRKVYLLTSDGHRDSVQLDKAASDEVTLKQLLIDYRKEIFNEEVIPESIQVTMESETITFYLKGEEDGYYTHRFFSIPVLQSTPDPVRLQIAAQVLAGMQTHCSTRVTIEGARSLAQEALLQADTLIWEASNG